MRFEIMTSDGAEEETDQVENTCGAAGGGEG